MIRVLILAFIAFFLFADPARADPVSATIAFFVAVKAVAIKIAIQIAITVAVSMLSKALAKKPVPPGIKTEFTQTGGTVSRTIILGMYATAGSFAAPPMSHGQDGKTPNAYYTQVITLADYYLSALTGVIVNGERIPIGGASTYGLALGGKYTGKAWIKFYDGNQTAADPMLVSRYGFYVRPWGNDRIGTGVPYAIMTYKYDPDLFKSEPAVKFEVQGAPLYDIRKDSTRGGSGTHRLDNRATWQATNNNIVMVWNILHGIELPGGVRYGGEAKLEDLPLANWVAAMNVCDENVSTSGGFEPRYRGGYEITIGDDEPADVIEQLLKACSGLITEIGGVYKVRVGPPALPVMFITDEDILVSKEQDFDPFPPINASINVVHATYPYPAENWVAHDAPVISDPAYIAADGGVEVPADLQFPAAPYPLQVQRIMLAWLKDDRRWRRHNMTLGHYAFMLEPLDVIAWTSARNGYDAKLFEIDTTVLSIKTLQNTLAVREVDPADYDWSSDDELPDPAVPGEWALPEVQAVPGWAVNATTIPDNDGDDRRVALVCSWTPDGAEDATALKIQVRLAGTAFVIAEKTVTNVIDGEANVIEGILPSTSYEARAQYIVDRPTEWSTWLGTTTGNVVFGPKDGVVLFPDGTAPIWTYPNVGALPDPPTDDQVLAFVESDGKLYRYVGGEWTAVVDGNDIEAGSVTTAAFAAGLRPNGVGGALPALPDAAWPVGSLFVLTTDGKTYTNRAGAWSADIAATDIEGQIIADQIANGAVLADKLAVGSVIASKIADGAVDPKKLNVQMGGGNLVGNSAFVKRGVDFRPLGWVAYNNGSIPLTYIDANGRRVGTSAFAIRADAASVSTFGMLASADGDVSGRVGGPAGGWLPNTEYIVSFYAYKAFGAGWSDMFLAWNTSPVEVDWYNRPNLSGAWQRYVVRLKWGATVESTGQLFVSVTGNTASGDILVISDIQVEQGNVVTAYAPRVDEILPGTVGTTQIADNAVSTEKLIAGSVVAGKIATGAITSDKIVAGAILTDKLAADAVTASKLHVGSSDNLVQNGNFDTGLDGWTLENSTTGGSITIADVGASSSWPSQYAMLFTRASAGGYLVAYADSVSYYGAGANQHGIECKPNDEFLLEFYVYQTSHAIYIDGVMLRGDGATDGVERTPILNCIGSGRVNVPINGFYKVQMSLKNTSGDTRRMYVRFIDDGAGAGVNYVWNVRLLRRSYGELIVDGAIIADKIAANAVTSPKIVAGAITADKINAGAVTASKVFIGDSSNMFPDPTFTDAAAFNLNANAAIVASGTVLGTSKGYLYVQAGGAGTNAGSIPMPVEASRHYNISSWLESDAGNTAHLHIYWYSDIDAAAYISNDTLMTASGGGVNHSVNVVAPNNARSARIIMWSYGINKAYLYGTVVRRASAGELIVDGAVIANKIAANAVTADKIVAGAITTGKIAAGAITATQIAAGQVTASKLAIVPDNIWPDPQFADDGMMIGFDGWVFQRNSFQSPWVAMGVRGGIGLFGGSYAPYNVATSRYNLVGFSAGKYHRVRIKYANSTGSNVYCRVTFYNQADAYVGEIAAIAVPNGGGFNIAEAVGIVPATAAFYNVVLFNTGTISYGQLWFSDLKFTEMSDSSLIVDGAILADKIAAGAITADKITAGAVTAAKINVTNLAAISADLGAVTAGSLNINNKAIIAADGTVTIQNSASGQRLVVTNSLIQVYDASNVLRVRLGIW